MKTDFDENAATTNKSRKLNWFSFGSMSITKKVAATIIAVNIAGLAVMGAFVARTSSVQGTETAIRGWVKDSSSISLQASGGVKWGKTEAVQSSYEVFRDNPDFGLTGIVAFNKDGTAVDTWISEAANKAEIAPYLATSLGDGKETKTERFGSQVIIATPFPVAKDGTSIGQLKTVWSTNAINEAAIQFALKIFAFQFAVLAISVVMLLLVLRRQVGRPLGNINARIQSLQNGDYQSDVPHVDKGDEVGVIARALTNFRDAAKAKQIADAEMENQRSLLDQERADNSSATDATMKRQQAVVAELGHALERLASGDLTIRLPELEADFRKLGEDFNIAITELAKSIQTIDQAQKSVAQASVKLESGTDDLARRTENQAASLEQTAAALDEITVTVQNASKKAQEAGELVLSARTGASHSGQVVGRAIEAMGLIEASSTKIAAILNVIDEIAFQTNLLALNAGVEAARAGEAGKGFAVVAQEVRDLAGRSAGAAKEIKELIEASVRNVQNGVSLVNETGSAITEIEHKVSEVASTVEAIEISAREQATGISQINSSMNEMDQMTQKNAAMVQENHDASRALGSQCAKLAEIVSGFTIDMSNATYNSSPTSVPKPRPQAVSAFYGNAARKVEPQNQWEDF